MKMAHLQGKWALRLVRLRDLPTRMNKHMNFDFPADHQSSSFALSRRRFVTGIAASGAVAGLGLSPWTAMAQPRPGNLDVLTGTDFALSISEVPVNITGQRRIGTLVNGSLPAPVPALA